MDRFQTAFGSPIDAKSRRGVAVLLDALGTKSTRTVEEWARLLVRRVETLRSVPWTIPSFGLVTDAEANPSGGSPKVSGVLRTAFGFSDNVLILFESDAPSDELLRATAHYLTRLFVAALRRGDKLRGAVSVESFFYAEDEHIAVGPAMTELGGYFEVADWAGIILTDSAANAWERSPSDYSMKRETQAVLWTRYLYQSPSAIERRSQGRTPHGPSRGHRVR